MKVVAPQAACRRAHQLAHPRRCPQLVPLLRCPTLPPSQPHTPRPCPLQIFVVRPRDVFRAGRAHARQGRLLAGELGRTGARAREGAPCRLPVAAYADPRPAPLHWQKFTEGPARPEVNLRGRLSKGMQLRHPAAPVAVQWHAGVILPHGVGLTNGTWSLRHIW